MSNTQEKSKCCGYEAIQMSSGKIACAHCREFFVADNTESWIERFNEKIKDYIVKIQVGQYDENNVNIGFLPAEQIVKSFISSEREKVRQEIVEAVKKIPTGNHKRADMRDDVLKVINK